MESLGRLNLKACKNVMMLVRNLLFHMQLLNKPNGNKLTKICVKHKEIDALRRDSF